MRAFVCFDGARGQRYALDVAHTGRVLPFTPLLPLPAPQPGVLGLVRDDGELLPVLALLGDTGRHVLVVQAGTGRFGLLVEAVTAVVRLREEELRPPPRGQDRSLVSAVAGGPGADALVLDPELVGEALAR